MTETKLDLILHPIRIRILVLMGARELTSQQLARLLPDIPQATLYRHINTLADGGILKVVAQNPIRGTVEKVYALADAGELNIQPDELATLSKEDHMRYFTTFAITLVQQFAQYLQQSEAVDFVKDGAGYHTVSLYMTDAELRAFSQELNKLMLPHLQPNDDTRRVQRLFSTVLMPSGNPDARDE